MTVRRLVLLSVLACGALTLGFGASSASAVLVCTPTTYSQDGMLLNAAYVNPADNSLPTNADASPCDIGVYYNTAGPHNQVGKNVFGARYYGVLADGSGVVSNFSHGSVYGTGNQPHDGSQHGINVAYRNGSSGQLDHSQIYDYQKGGVVVDGTGSSATVLSNVIRGLGPVPFIAQNGVQYSRGATGVVNNNFISDNQYTGCPKQSTTCDYVVSAGVLLYGVSQKQVDTKNNTYRNNDVNLLNVANAG